MADETLRKSMAAAVRTVLKEGLRKAEDPVTYLRSAATEIRQLVILFEQEVGTAGDPNTAIRTMLAEEVEAAAEDLIRRLRH